MKFYLNKEKLYYQTENSKIGVKPISQIDTQKEFVSLTCNLQVVSQPVLPAQFVLSLCEQDPDC